MILDKIENLKMYKPVLDSADKIYDFICDFIKAPKENGRYELDGKDLYANIDSYETKPENGALFEAHKKYIDLQVIMTGEEKIGWASPDALKPDGDFNEEKDIGFFNGAEDSWITVKNGNFVILFPEDAHKPCITVDGNSKFVKKIVFKIACK